MRPIFKPQKINLGEDYKITFKYGNQVIGRFIKITKTGYNFLNLKTNKCIFKKHFYKSKCENHLSEDWFFIYDGIKITKYEN